MSGLQFADDLVGHLAWPVIVAGIVAVIIWKFEAPIAARIRKMRSVELPGGVKATFDADELASAGSDLVNAIEASAVVSDVVIEGKAAGVVIAAPAGTVDITVPDEIHMTDEVTVEKTTAPDPWQQELEQAVAASKRRDVEKIIDQAARWGHDQAERAMGTLLDYNTPLVEWSEENEPRIVGVQDRKGWRLRSNEIVNLVSTGRVQVDPITGRWVSVRHSKSPGAEGQSGETD